MTSSGEWINGKITDSAIEVLRSRLGNMGTMGPATDQYSHAAINRYLATVGDDNPLFWDDAYAAKTRWGGVIAPPRMLIKPTEDTPGNVTEPIDETRVTFMGEDVLQGVFAMVSGCRIVFEQPVRLGDTLRNRQGPHGVVERQSRMAGRSLELINKVEFVNQRDELVATAYESVIRMERGAARDSRKYLDIPPAKYTAEEMEKFWEHLVHEYDERRGGEARYWEDAEVGEPLLTLAKGPLTISDIAAYFIALGYMFWSNRVKHFRLQADPAKRLINPETNIEDEWASAHWDEYFARQSGIPRPYDEGPMRYDNMAHLVTDWMGDDGVLKELSVSLRAPVLLGDISWCTGKVVGKRVEGDSHLTDLELWITNQRGDRSTIGSAIVELPSRG